ncbi:MAG: dihydroneopterin aldolase [Candidatus Hatepunaea meridiana]|nr:dihydroneopterin aldolase [Candidatus Hatepunaea meridiana]
MDKVRLKKLRFYAYHGCHKKEREQGQIIELDIELIGSLARAGVTDDISDTFDFDKILEIATETITGTKYNLLEALGEHLCRRIIVCYPDVRVKLVLRKPDPPVNGELECVEVEIVRP